MVVLSLVIPLAEGFRCITLAIPLFLFAFHLSLPRHIARAVYSLPVHILGPFYSNRCLLGRGLSRILYRVGLVMLFSVAYN
jgi:hypothetical protein